MEQLIYRNQDWSERYDNIILKAVNNTITHKYDKDDSGILIAKWDRYLCRLPVIGIPDLLFHG